MCPVQGLVDEGHAPRPVLQVLHEHLSCQRVVGRTFKAEQGDERSKVVFDPVVDLREEDFFFCECHPEFPLIFFQVLFRVR